MDDATPTGSDDIFRASDGYKWHYRRYTPPGKPRGHLVCLHGIQSHAGWYEASSARLCSAGYLVYFLDRRGSGRNQQDRGDTPSFSRLLDDVAEFLRSSVIADKGLPVFLLGISWGGKLALGVAILHPQIVDGLLLLCPGLFPRIRPRLLTRLAILAASGLMPRKRFPIPLNDPELFTATQHGRNFIRNDPLALHQATARFFMASVQLDVLSRRFSGRLGDMPVLLLLAGKDQIIHNERTRRFVESLAHPDKMIRTYREAQHTLEFEPDSERFLGDIERWLDAHCRHPARRPTP